MTKEMLDALNEKHHKIVLLDDFLKIAFQSYKSELVFMLEDQMRMESFSSVKSILDAELENLKNEFENV